MLGAVEGGVSGSSQQHHCFVAGGVFAGEPLQGAEQRRAVFESWDHREGGIAEDQVKGEQVVDVLGTERAAEHIGLPAQAVIGHSDLLDVFLEALHGTTVGFDEHDRAGASTERFQADRPGSGEQVGHLAVLEQVEVLESLEEDLLE